MSKIWNGIVDFFLGWGWFVAIIMVIGFVVFKAIEQSNYNEQYCFDHQMVIVHGDFGTKCVKIEALVNING